jgi:hypothetical protein
MRLTIGKEHISGWRPFRGIFVGLIQSLISMCSSTPSPLLPPRDRAVSLGWMGLTLGCRRYLRFADATPSLVSGCRALCAFVDGSSMLVRVGEGNDAAGATPR